MPVCRIPFSSDNSNRLRSDRIESLIRNDNAFYILARLLRKKTIGNLGTVSSFRDGIGWKLKTSLKGKLKISNRITSPNKSL